MTCSCVGSDSQAPGEKTTAPLYNVTTQLSRASVCMVCTVEIKCMFLLYLWIITLCEEGRTSAWKGVVGVGGCVGLEVKRPCAVW